MRSWLYRIRPAVHHTPFERLDQDKVTQNWDEQLPNPNWFRWRPFDIPGEGDQVDWVRGLRTLAGAGDPRTRNGLAIYIYTCNVGMKDTCM